MSPLRQQMIEAIRQRGYSARTERSYTYAVADLARYHRRSPEALEPADIQAYFRHLALERELSPASCHLALNAIRFLYLQVLGRERFDVEVAIPKREQRIPDLLTRAEVHRILERCPNPKHHAALATAYGCGLRVSELVSLRVKDIDGERSLAHVVQGKGAKDRMVILSEGLLEVLRGYWRLYRPSSWLFPGHRPDVSLSIESVQKAFTRAKRRAAINKIGGVHSLRHAYATQQLAAGLPVHVLQRLLGHSDLRSTLRYVHWVPGYRDGGERHCDLIGTPESQP